MKKSLFIVLPVLLLITFGGWNFIENKQTEAHSLPIEMAASNSLMEEESALIPVSPKDSQVEKVDVMDEVGAMINKDYSQSKVYKVTFNRAATETDEILLCL